MMDDKACGSTLVHQFIPEVLNGVEVAALCRGKTASLQTFLGALGLCHVETGPGLSRTDADAQD